MEKISQEEMYNSLQIVKRRQDKLYKQNLELCNVIYKTHKGENTDSEMLKIRYILYKNGLITK